MENDGKYPPCLLYTSKDIGWHGLVSRSENGFYVEDIIAVSYTHLDVYKRQGIDYS